MILKEINTYNIKRPHGIAYLCDLPFIATERELYLGNTLLQKIQLEGICGIYCEENIYLRSDKTLKIMNYDFDNIKNINLLVNYESVCIWDMKINYNDQFVISDYLNNRVHIFDSSFNHIKGINISSPLGIEIDIENKLYICSKNNIKIYDDKYINSIDIKHPEHLCFYKNKLIIINNYGVYYENKKILEYREHSITNFIKVYNNKLCVSRSDINKVIEYEIIEEK